MSAILILAFRYRDHSETADLPASPEQAAQIL
jgi:hypothetical protein